MDGFNLDELDPAILRAILKPHLTQDSSNF